MTVTYILEQGSGTAGPWNPVPGSPFTTLTDTITGLSAGNNYFFRLTAQDPALNLVGPPTIVGPYTVVQLTESAQGTRLTSTTGTIVDANLGVWSIVTVFSAPTVSSSSITSSSVGLSWTTPTGTQRAKHPDGTNDGSNVTVLLYWNHLVYRDDDAGWAHWNGSTWVADPGDPSVVVTESPDKTSITTTTGQIVDATGGTWRLVTSPSSGLQIVHNGTTDTSTSNVIQLYYSSHTVYQENSGLNWFYWNGSSWIITSDPTVALNVESTNGTQIQTTVGHITDASLDVWTLVSSPSSGLQIAKNGVTDTASAQVLELLYWNHTVYQKSSNTNENNITPGWWAWNGNSYTAVNGDPSGPVTTWSTTDKAAAMTLSTNNLAVTTRGSSGNQTIRSTSGYTTGKFFFELTLTNITVDVGIGFANSSYNLTNPDQIGFEVAPGTSVGYYPIFDGPAPQCIFIGGTGIVTSQGTIQDVNGAILSCAVDFGAKLVWFTSPAMRSQTTGGVNQVWNNSTTANPATAAGGITFSTLNPGPYFVAATDDIGQAILTVNFGATAFSRQVPTGFAPWAPGVGTTGGVVVNNPIFNEEFDTLSLRNIYTGATGRWQPAFWYSPRDAGTVINDAWVVNPFNPATPINNIYTIAGSQLNMNLRQTPSNLVAACGNAAYVGGQLQTIGSGFTHQEGYWEMRCAIPHLIGVVTAWFLMEDGPWPPELDIMEWWTNSLGFFFGKFSVWSQTSHGPDIVSAWYTDPSEGAPLNGTAFTNNGFTGDLTQMHSYGLWWQPTTLTLYIDRAPMFQCPKPADYNVPLGMITELFSGGSTAGSIVNPTVLPITWQIDYVKVWASRPF